MKIHFRCPLATQLERRVIEETCCLYALGELTVEESGRWEQHLHDCESCRTLTREFEQVMLFDLPAIAVAQLDTSTPVEPAHVDQAELLANIRAKAAAIQGRMQQSEENNDRWSRILELPKKATGSALWSPIALALWGLAAVLLLAVFGTMSFRSTQTDFPPTQSVQLQAEDGKRLLEGRILTAERQLGELTSQLTQVESRARNSQAAYLRSSAQAQTLDAANSELESQLNEAQGKVTQREAELELARKSLGDEVASKDALKANLTEIYDRLEKEKSEVARLERCVLVGPFPFSRARSSPRRVRGQGNSGRARSAHC